MRTLVRTLALIVVAAAAIVAAAPTYAQSKPAAKKPPAASAPTKAQSAMQVAGIAERVVDNLWVQTDHYWHEGDYNRIVDLCRVVAEAEPSFNDAYENAAWLLWSMGDTLGADLFLQHGIAHSDNKGEVMFEFGRHLYTTKRYTEAESYLRQSITYPGAPYAAYATLGHTYERLGQPNKALPVWEKAVVKFPEMGAAKVNRDRVKNLASGTPK